MIPPRNENDPDTWLVCNFSVDHDDAPVRLTLWGLHCFPSCVHITAQLSDTIQRLSGVKHAVVPTLWHSEWLHIRLIEILVCFWMMKQSKYNTKLAVPREVRTLWDSLTALPQFCCYKHTVSFQDKFPSRGAICCHKHALSWQMLRCLICLCLPAKHWSTVSTALYTVVSFQW